MSKSRSAAVKSFDIPKALVWQAYYYGRFYRSRLYLLLQRINTYLMRWAGKKYKPLRGFRRFHAWCLWIVRHDPALFAHCLCVRTLTVAELR